jgi:hypothetical protein
MQRLDYNKTFVIVKTFQLSFHVFVCAFHLEDSFVGKSFLFIYQYPPTKIFCLSEDNYFR